MSKVFEAAVDYARTVLVRKVVEECLGCRQRKEVLSFDSSDSEYTTMFFCRDCLADFSKGKISQSTYGNRNLRDF